MRLKIFALASVCAMTAGAAIGFADPQAGDPYTQNPTPQERAQTQELNSERAASAVAQDQSQDQAANPDQVQQYQDQQQQYQNEQDRYHAQQQRYRDERAEYNYDRSHPFDWWRARYERASLDSFYDIPRAELVDLRVDREDGYRVGRIREVERSADGRVTSVKILLLDGDFAWVNTRELRYEPDDRIVFTDLSIPQIHELARNS